MNLPDSERPVEHSCQRGGENCVPSQLRNLSIGRRNKLFIQTLVYLVRTIFWTK